ncbi:tetratricopeptide repeat protein [Streptomyces sp. NPDC056500]|uniref:tetratricopeptide repeat protein n=1 Tax=Streptomyces sp. NPDC056500 TaxID=3345840 RepID=UPI0036B8BD57
MEAELGVAVVGTVGTLLGLGVAWRQLRVHGRAQPPDPSPYVPEPYGSSVHPPSLPPRPVRGRDELLGTLRKRVRRPRGGILVLTGPGGVGKSTVATALAEWARKDRHRGRERAVWWVSGGDPDVLAAGLVSIARRAGAQRADLEALAVGSADAADRFWDVLRRAPAGWLLVLDEADDPHVLTGPGWLRPVGRSLIVVTTRHAGADAWGGNATLLPVPLLDEEAGALVLTDLAPAAGGPGAARDLAHRLGGFPLTLTLAGAHLGSGVARRATFTAFRSLLDAPLTHDWPGDPGPAAAPRATVTLTWEISLDALDRQGAPEARTLLRLLSCYLPGAPVPRELIDTGVPALAALAGAEPAVERALRGLVDVGLLAADQEPDDGAGLTVHPVVADISRLHLGPLRNPGDDPEGAGDRRIPAVAAELLVAAIGRLRMDQPADWHHYRRLAPHLGALHRTAAGRLDPPLLAALTDATADAARAADRDGAHRSAARLCLTGLEHSTPLGPDHPAVLALQHQRAWQICFQGDGPEAETLYRQVYAARRRVLGEAHRDTLASRHELAWIAACQGRWAEAEDAYRQVLAARETLCGHDSPDTLTTAHELAWAIANQGRYTEAATALGRIHEDRRRILGVDHPQTLASRHELAWVRGMDGGRTEAEALYREVLHARLQVLGESHPETLTTRHELAWTLAALGRIAEAERISRSVLALRRRVLGEEHPDTVATLRALETLRRGEPFEARHVV